MELVIAATGDARCIYEETIDLTTLGRLVISRASHVEPDANGQWRADLSVVGGPCLGPFACRSEALRAEQVWLAANWLIQQG